MVSKKQKARLLMWRYLEGITSGLSVSYDFLAFHDFYANGLNTDTQAMIMDYYKLHKLNNCYCKMEIKSVNKSKIVQMDQPMTFTKFGQESYCLFRFHS